MKRAAPIKVKICLAQIPNANARIAVKYLFDLLALPTTMTCLPTSYSQAAWNPKGIVNQDLI